MSTTKPVAIPTSVVCADYKLNIKQGWTANCLTQYYSALMDGDSVEVGWRTCCGSTHITAVIYREWLKIIKNLRHDGAKISSTRVKHKNGYATNNGGFWNSEIFKLETL